MNGFLVTPTPAYSGSAHNRGETTLDNEASLEIQHMYWIMQRWIFRAPSAQPIITCNYGDIKPDHRTPIEGLYLETMTQIYPEDRGQNCSIKMDEEVAQMVIEDHAKRGAKPEAAA